MKEVHFTNHEHEILLFKTFLKRLTRSQSR